MFNRFTSICSWFCICVKYLRRLFKDLFCRFCYYYCRRHLWAALSNIFLKTYFNFFHISKAQFWSFLNNIWEAVFSVKYLVVKIPPGDWLGVSVSAMVRGWGLVHGHAKSFWTLSPKGAKSFNFLKWQVRFQCPHHLWLSPPLKLHSFASKTIIHRSPPPPNILGQKAKNNH